MNGLRNLIAKLTESNYALYALATQAREVFRGREPLPHRPEFQGRDRYVRDYAKWQALRSRILEKDERRLRELALANAGPTVASGPFKGMKLSSCQGTVNAATLLGFYEAELHSTVEECVARPYVRVINVGCSHGYYAVGMAIRMPAATVFAYDRDGDARALCIRLAEENGVAERVIVRGAFTGPEFQAFDEAGTLVICDIEGGELEVLDPAAYPALRQMDILAELHEALHPGISRTILDRFRESQDIRWIEEGNHPPLDLPPWVRSLGSVERHIACHGGLRWGPTPWAAMTRRSKINGAIT